MEDMAAHAPQPPQRRECPYSAGYVSHHPLVSISPENWDEELQTFFDTQSVVAHEGVPALKDPFIVHVVAPMWTAWVLMKYTPKIPQRYDMALEILTKVKASDWKKACIEWVLRRKKKSDRS